MKFLKCNPSHNLCNRLHPFLRIASFFLVFLASESLAVDFYVSSQAGDDARDGQTPDTAWKGLEKVNNAPLMPGDRVFFQCGSVWNGQLRISASGTHGKPLQFNSYGSGSFPRIDTAGTFEDAILIRNAQYVEVRNLELTNRGVDDRPRRGVNIVADNCGTLKHIIVSGLFIHDVNGTQRNKDNGGINFRTLGNRSASRFDGLFLERNIIWRVDRSGIAAQSYHASRKRWNPSINVIIRDNWVGDVGGDGIVPWATDGCIVEHNIVQGANERAGNYNAGIWPWSTDNTVMRLNRASGVKTLKDGQGFDSDYNSRNTILEYNLSHDNEGGFLLICTPGKRNPDDNIGNLGTIARYNISRNDRARTFHVSAAQNTLIHDNAVYIETGLDVQMILLTDWSGWPDGLEVSNNLFHSTGIARYGHEISRSKDGSYGIGAGWGPATNVVFGGNRYVGKHIDAPSETKVQTLTAPQPMEFNDWPGPQFDPKQPQQFSAFIKEHRAWMLRLMEKQFGRKPATLPEVLGEFSFDNPK